MSYSYLWKIARASVNVTKTKLLPLVGTPSTGENITARLITRLVSFVIVKFHFTEMTGDCHLAS